MELSKAIRYGRGLRLESHQEGWPFVRIANEDSLRSDPWGAALEAVHSPIAKREWTEATYQSDMARFVELQLTVPARKRRGFFAHVARC
jgi:hypothetical protein